LNSLIHAQDDCRALVAPLARVHGGEKLIKHLKRSTNNRANF
jgi:hypothetical protein